MMMRRKSDGHKVAEWNGSNAVSIYNMNFRTENLSQYTITIVIFVIEEEKPLKTMIKIEEIKCNSEKFLQNSL